MFQRTKVPRPFRSGEPKLPTGEQKFQEAIEPGNKRARERMDQGEKGSESELVMLILANSLLGANWYGSEKVVESKPTAAAKN